MRLLLSYVHRKSHMHIPLCKFGKGRGGHWSENFETFGDDWLPHGDFSVPIFIISAYFEGHQRACSLLQLIFHLIACFRCECNSAFALLVIMLYFKANGWTKHVRSVFSRFPFLSLHILPFICLLITFLTDCYFHINIVRLASCCLKSVILMWMISDLHKKNVRACEWSA